MRPYPPTEFPEEKEETLKYYSSILNKVKELLEDEKLIESIMDKYEKAKETKENCVFWNFWKWQMCQKKIISMP